MGSAMSKIKNLFQLLPLAVVRVPKVNILMVHIWAFRLRHSIKKMAIGNIIRPNDERIPKLFLPPLSAVGQLPSVSMLMVHLGYSIKGMAIRTITRPNDERSPFNFLPDELLLKILAYVSLSDLALQMRRLGNRRLRRICEDSSICKSITVDEMWDKHTARAVLCMTGPRLEELTVAVKKKKDYYFNLKEVMASKPATWDAQEHLRDRVESDAVLSNLLSVIGEFGNKITLCKLSIKTKLHVKHLPMFCPLSNTFIANVPSCLRNLTKIDMRDAAFMNSSGSNNWMKAIADHCTYLQHIRLPFLKNLTDKEFKYFLFHVQRTLKHLSLFCFKLTDFSYCDLKHCQHLETLIIEAALHIRQEGLKTILELPNLQQLYISYAKKLTGVDFAQVLHGKVMPKMVCLEMDNVAASTDDVTLEMISKSYPNLHLLLLYLRKDKGASNVGIRSILDRCRKLAFFSMYQYDGKPPILTKGFYSHFIQGTLNHCTYQSEGTTWEKQITSLRWPELLWNASMSHGNT